MSDVRKRVKLATTVHSDTIVRLTELGAKFQSTQGRIIDKLVEVLHRAMTDGRVYCIHGGGCVANRTDVPKVL